MAFILKRLAPSALLAALALLPAGPAAAAGKLVEETVDVPRATRVPLTLAFEKSAIFALESQNDPKPADVEDARRKTRRIRPGSSSASSTAMTAGRSRR
ncbi:MAG: hypothetical protein IPP07_27670 [Holophagales bacterium]|nr:hypothetical protein [Holophagales bacterium]